MTTDRVYFEQSTEETWYCLLQAHCDATCKICDIPLSKNLFMQTLTSGVVTRLRLEKVSSLRDKFPSTRTCEPLCRHERGVVHTWSVNEVVLKFRRSSMNDTLEDCVSRYREI